MLLCTLGGLSKMTQATGAELMAGRKSMDELQEFTKVITWTWNFLHLYRKEKGAISAS